MIEGFVRWLCGYLLIYIKGGETTRFVNLCNANAINLRRIRKDQEGLSCYISLKQYRMLKPISKKCGVIPFIRKRTGFPFLLYRIKRRKILFASFLLFLSFIYILSLYVWNISFEGNYLHTDEQLREFLKELSVEVGMKKAEVDSQQIEDRIRMQYPDIGWVSAALNGTKLSIMLVETRMPEPPGRTQDAFQEADIVAAKDGIVQSIVVRTGTAKVKAGDVVRAGDVLVSGLVPVIGDSGEAVSINRIVPDADITMKTVEAYRAEFSMAYEKKMYTGIEKSGYDVILFGQGIFSYLPSHTYLEYDTIRELVHLRVSKDFYLPFTYQKTTYREYIMEQRIYTQEEAIQIAAANLERYLGALEVQGATVDSLDTRTEIIKGNCITSGKLTLLEPAFAYAAIP